MKHIILAFFLMMLVFALCACTESATQWHHQEQSEEKQRDLDRDNFQLEQRVRELEKRLDVLETK